MYFPRKCISLICVVAFFATPSTGDAGLFRRNRNSKQCAPQSYQRCCAPVPCTVTYVCPKYPVQSGPDPVLWYAVNCPTNSGVGWYGPRSNGMGDCSTGANCEAQTFLYAADSDKSNFHPSKDIVEYGIRLSAPLQAGDFGTSEVSVANFDSYYVKVKHKSSNPSEHIVVQVISMDLVPANNTLAPVKVKFGLEVIHNPGAMRPIQKVGHGPHHVDIQDSSGDTVRVLTGHRTVPD